MNTTEVLDKLSALGITARAAGEKLLLEPGSKVPADLMAEVRERKVDIINYLRRQTELIDLPFPIGYGGLPSAQVEAAEAVMDKFGVTDPILRSFNILSWVQGYYQDRGENHGDYYEALKREQSRLSRILDGR